MYFNHLMALSAASLLTASTFAIAAETTPSSAMSQMRKDHPRLRTMNRDGKIHKLADKQLAIGSSPKETANNFILNWSAALEVDPNEFIERGPFLDGHTEQQLMFNPETGTYKFTGVYYTQSADGLPVYDSRLMVLVRNVDGYPAVAATTDLRDVRGFKVSKRAVVNDAVALMAAASRLGKDVTISSPELMVFAGSESSSHEPAAVLVFEAVRGGDWDFENYAKLELVVDAETGAILHEKNLILHADGNVSGMATESSGADVCEAESSAGMPYARVTLSGNTAYADANGNYSVAGSGTITSYLDGLWFDVDTNGSTPSLSQNSSSPNFVHSEANSNEQRRAEVNAYLQSNIVRDFTLQHVPNYPTIGNQNAFPVHCGVSGTCNAFYDYSSINFYNSGSGCSNTAFSVIVHHEYGHHLVAVAGSGQDAYGEGMGDVMGVLITGDSELARGFYSNDCNNGIRTADNNYQYGGSCSGIHDCGQLISGCVWDTLGTMSIYPDGHSVVSRLAINSIMLHTGGSIDPTITFDWLTLDDDDGDLDNGTPHSVEILAGFGMHNMDQLPEPLDNDYCSTAREIADGDWSFTTVGALTDGDPYNEDQCAGTYLGEMASDVWFSYIACESGSMTVSTCDSVSFDSDIVVYQGNSCGDKVQVACNGDGDGCGNYTSSTTFNVTEGAQYYIRVGGWSSSSTGSGTLVVDGPGDGCVTDPAVVISYPNGQPSLVDPNGGTVVEIDVAAGTSEPMSGMLNWNSGSGWNDAPLDGSYNATFSAFDCGDSVDWYISVETVDGDIVVSPAGAPSNSWNALAYSGSEVIFDDDFQTDQGWSVDASAGTGNWDRVTPSTGGVRCDAPSDADGSGICYVTGNGTDEDVDDGTTTLYSPVMDASEAPVLSYSRWYNNGLPCNGADSQNDYFYVDISSDGGSSWSNLETVGPVNESSGGWYFVEHDLSSVSGFEPSANFMVRFVCGDLGAGSVIEAAVDGVGLSRSYCDEASCTGDVNNDGSVDVTDLLEVVGAWGASGGAADVNDDGVVNVTDLLTVVDAWGPCQ